MTDPQSLEAEEYVIGSCLMSSSVVERVSSIVSPEMFYRESNEVMFRALVEMVDAGSPTEPALVEAYLKERGLLDVVERQTLGVYSYFTGNVVTANALHYAKLVRDSWKKRLVLRAITDIQANIETLSASDAVTALDKAALEIEELTDEKHELVVDLKDLVEAKRYEIDHPEAAKPTVPTPFTFLPDLVGGRLYVLSGYMKDGKSRCALQFAAAAAASGRRVGVASGEMSKKDLFDAWACQRTGLPSDKIEQPWLLDERQRDTLEDALQVMSPRDVQVIDDETLDPFKLRRYQRAGKYDLLIIDHLHRMAWKDRHHIEQGVKQITNIAREFEIPVILLAQLNRSSDQAKPFPVPTMNRLRETAMIEGEASAVWFVYRERDDDNLVTSRAQFITAATRYGRAGVEIMWFDDASQTFQEQGWKPVEQKPEGLVAF